MTETTNSGDLIVYTIAETLDSVTAQCYDEIKPHVVKKRICRSRSSIMQTVQIPTIGALIEVTQHSLCDEECNQTHDRI